MINIWLDIKKDIDRVDPKNVYIIMDNRTAYVTEYLKDRDVCIVNSHRRKELGMDSNGREWKIIVKNIIGALK